MLKTDKDKITMAREHKHTEKKARKESRSKINTKWNMARTNCEVEE